MASTPLSYNPSQTPIDGTEQIVNLAVGITPQEYSSSPGGVTWWMGPEEDDGYVIGVPVSGNTQPTNLSGVTASVGFWRSPLLTEESFVEYTNGLFGQNFTGGTQAKTWLNSNGYWTSYKDVYRYDSGLLLAWPASSTGYTLYNGGFTSNDDGYSNSPITLPVAFETNNQSSTNLYLSTNGYFTLVQGDNNIINNYSQMNANPATMAGNGSDLWMQPGLVMNDGDTQNWYYQTGSDSSAKFYVKNLVYCGTYGSTTFPKSYLINFYRDEQYQWLETRIKSNAASVAGPYDVVNVTQGPSTTSRVWRGDLNGQNWVYLGTGSVQV